MIDLTRLPIDITLSILNFRDFLNISWSPLMLLMKNHDWEEDGFFCDEWIQANWEFLIERELLGKDKYLLPLDFGSRVTFPEKKPEYKVACEPAANLEMIDWMRKKNNYNGEELLISGFGCLVGITYGLYPPFDFVEVSNYDNKKLYVLPISSCSFWLKPHE